MAAALTAGFRRRLDLVGAIALSSLATMSDGAASCGYRVIARERGSLRPDNPVFASEAGLVALEAEPALAPAAQPLTGAGEDGRLLRDVLTPAECARIVAAAEAMGFGPDAPVSLGRDVRHNDNVVWIADSELNDAIFERARALLPPSSPDGGRLVGLNRRWRLYRYGVDDIFRAHTDGAWPGSGVDARTGAPLGDQYGDGTWSAHTFLVYLNDDFDGGETRFFERLAGGPADGAPAGWAESARVRPETGAVLLFAHGERSPLHEGARITRGVKYVLRTDVLYAPPAAGR